MLKRTALTMIALAWFPSAALAEKPAPFADPNGHLSGEVDGKAFDLPVMCRTEGMFFQAISHDDGGMFTSSGNQGVEPAVQLMFFSGSMGFTGYLAGEKYQFGSQQKTPEKFPFAYEGEVRSKDRGKYPARMQLTCPDAPSN